MYLRALLVILAVTVLIRPGSSAAQTLTLSTAPGNVVLNPGGARTWHSSFGTMNALGVGAPQAGVTVIPLSNGALYYFRYQLTATGLNNGHRGVVTAFINNQFGNAAALILESCPSTGACVTAGEYAALSTNGGAPTTIVPAPGIINNQTVTAGLAIFLPDNNGPNAFTGTDNARIRLTLTDTTSNATGTANLRLDQPNERVENAVQLTLAGAPGGLAVTPAADFIMNFGNVNGLGVGPGAGLTTVGAAGGVIYATPYLLDPAFSDFASTTGTINVFVSTDFAHPLILQLQDSGGSGGPYSAISKVAGAQTQITAAAADRSSMTRFLGLFVSNVNGPTAFTGTDNATLTFTLTVP